MGDERWLKSDLQKEGAGSLAGEGGEQGLSKVAQECPVWATADTEAGTEAGDRVSCKKFGLVL